MRAPKTQQGFSMIELMMVMLIGLILMAIAIPNFMQAYRANRLNSAMIDISNIVQRTRFEAVRLNRSIACRVIPGAPMQFFVDLNGDTAVQPDEPTVIIPAEFQFNIAGTPGPASLGLGATATPPLRITFDGRGVPDYSATAPGMNMGGATPVLLATIGNVNRPQDGYRALTVTPVGKLTIWRAQAGGTWSHSQ